VRPVYGVCAGNHRCLDNTLPGVSWLTLTRILPVRGLLALPRLTTSYPGSGAPLRAVAWRAGLSRRLTHYLLIACNALFSNHRAQNNLRHAAVGRGGRAGGEQPATVAGRMCNALRDWQQASTSSAMAHDQSTALDLLTCAWKSSTNRDRQGTPPALCLPTAPIASRLSSHGQHAHGTGRHRATSINRLLKAGAGGRAATSMYSQAEADKITRTSQAKAGGGIAVASAAASPSATARMTLTSHSRVYRITADRHRHPTITIWRRCGWTAGA